MSVPSLIVVLVAILFAVVVQVFFLPLQLSLLFLELVFQILALAFGQPLVYLRLDIRGITNFFGLLRGERCLTFRNLSIKLVDLLQRVGLLRCFGLHLGEVHVVSVDVYMGQVRQGVCEPAEVVRQVKIDVGVPSQLRVHSVQLDWQGLVILKDLLHVDLPRSLVEAVVEVLACVGLGLGPGFWQLRVFEVVREYFRQQRLRVTRS